MELCVVKHKVKKNGNSTKKSLGSYDTEDSRTKENHCCFEVCALCLSSTMHGVCQIVHVAKSGGGLEDGARGRVEGDYEGMHKCEIDIQREGVNTCADVRSGGAMKNK